MSKVINIKNYKISGEHATICVPVVEKTHSDIVEGLKRAVAAGASMIELRADFFDDLFEENALDSLLKDCGEICKNTILLFTIRTSDEGGEAVITEELYKKILLKTSLSGHVDLIDCELDKVKKASEFIEELKSNGVKVVASHHNFKQTYSLEKIYSIYERMNECGADILKLAMMPENKADVLTLLASAEKFTSVYDESLIVAIAMGELGKATRVMGSFVGSCITFASLEKASAPGQIAMEDMKTLLSILNY